MGNWDNAFIKSIIFVGLASTFYLLVMAFIDSYEPHEFVLVLVLYGTGYLFISFVGWMLIGLPAHYIISKFTNAAYIYYIAVILVLTFIYWLFANTGSALFFGSFAVIQALIFRYYVYKKHNKPFKQDK
jgi:hypothetical protein